MSADTKALTLREAHTPLPWRADGDRVYGADGYIVADTGSVHVHETHDGDKGHWNYEDGSARDFSQEEEEANAALIVAALAAAPDNKALARKIAEGVQRAIPNLPDATMVVLTAAIQHDLDEAE